MKTGSDGEFYQILVERISNLHLYFQNMKEGGPLSNHFSQPVSYQSVPTLDNDNISDKNL